MNLTDEQKDLLRLLVAEHESHGGQEFIYIRSRTPGLVYPDRSEVRITHDHADFLQLERNRFIILYPVGRNMYRGKPTQPGIEALEKASAVSGHSAHNKVGESAVNTQIMDGHDHRRTGTVGPLFRKEGQYWTIIFAEKKLNMKDSKGMLYLLYLLSHLGREVAAVDLLAAGEGQQVTPGRSSSGEVADRHAVNEYKARAAEIGKEIEGARGSNDIGRVEHLLVELEFIADQISGAEGLGGRLRTTGDSTERARKSVREAICRAIEQIRKGNSSLAEHLDKHISFGTSLSYSGDTSWIF